MATQVLEFTVGVVLIAVVLIDVFLTVVVPRRTTSRVRVAGHMIRAAWPVWRRWGVGLQPAWRREEFLGTFAPLMIVLALAVWVLVSIVGYALLLHALADQTSPPAKDFFTALYLAGVSLLTIGFGDIVPVGIGARLVTLLAGASGLAILALVISLTFNLYALFARREVLVLLLDARAGVPPSGVMLLETFGRQRVISELARTFAEYEAWIAEVLDSHLAYSILPYFRSSHDGQSWVSAMGAVLDAATLLVTVVADEPTADPALRAARANAVMLYRLGCHALVDLTQAGFSRDRLARMPRESGIERAEFDTACRQLTEAGYGIVNSDVSWQKFADSRAVYSARLNLLARFFSTPATQWIGDRTVLAHLHHDDHLGP